MNYEAIANYSQAASALLFVLAMAWVWVKYIQPAVLTAQDNQNAQLAEAERRRDEARAELDSLKDAIEHAKADALAIDERVRAQAAFERERALRETRDAGERAVRAAQGELERSLAAARERLRDDLLGLGMQRARELAAQRVDAALDRRLVAAFMNRLTERGGLN